MMKVRAGRQARDRGACVTGTLGGDDHSWCAPSGLSKGTLLRTVRLAMRRTIRARSGGTDSGASSRALLAFLLSEPDPAWDGSYVTVKSPADDTPQPLGLVEFDDCISAKLGAPNDEVFEGHPLNGRGLEAYGAQRVVNSRWLKELEAINSVHHCYRPESWRGQTHFVLWFHDSTFECLARSFKIETHRTSMRALLGLMVGRLTS